MSKYSKESFDNIKSYYNTLKQVHSVSTQEDFSCKREGGDDHMPRWVCKGEIKVLDYKGRSKIFKADGVSANKKDAKDKFIGLIIEDFEKFVLTSSNQLTPPVVLENKVDENIFQLNSVNSSSSQIQVSSADLLKFNPVCNSETFLTPKDNKGFIGNGGFGKVFVCIKNDNSKKLLALKIPINEKETYQQEFDYHMKASDNEFVAQVYGTTIVQNRRAIIMEYCSRGNLLDVTENHLLPPSVICRIFLQVAKAIAYLHKGNSQRMTHNDIKPDNILITKDFEARLSDFGASTEATRTSIRSTVDRVKRGVAYTYYFLSPERHRNLDKLPKKSDDIYSFGVCLFVSLWQVSYHHHDLFYERYKRFERSLTKPIRDRLYDLEKNDEEVEANALYNLLKIIHLCCAENPDDRPSIECLHDKLKQIYDQINGLSDAVLKFIRQESEGPNYPNKVFKYDETWVDVKNIQINHRPFFR